MNIFLENVDLKSNSGPNYFAQKLIKYLSFRGVTFDQSLSYDKKLTFIQSVGLRQDLKMILRLDGIYFNAGFDCEKMNYNIKKSYEMAEGIIFQTEFNKNLIFNWFGEHPNYCIINNGADIIKIREFSPNETIVNKFKNFNKIWSCAASWHSFKRLKSNIEYFLNFSDESDCLVIAGKDPDYVIENPRIFYVGYLTIDELYSLYHISSYFIHLAYLDHCPNVVIDAYAFGCKIICSSAGGTKEIAGEDAIIVNEPMWDYSFIKESIPPRLNFNQITNNIFNSEISMTKVSKKYEKFLRSA